MKSSSKRKVLLETLIKELEKAPILGSLRKEVRIRAELYQKPGGRFSFDNTGGGSRSNIRARFIRRDGQNYLKVEGSGTASIDFALKTDDNPRSKGNAQKL